VLRFRRGIGGAFGSRGLRGLLTLGASVLVAELSALFFGLLTDPGFLPGLRRAGFSAEFSTTTTPGGLTVMLEFGLACPSLANWADGDAASGLDRGGDERPLAELNCGETPRAPTPTPASSWCRARSSDMLRLIMDKQARELLRGSSCGDLEAVANCADDAGRSWGWSWPKRDDKRVAPAGCE
jgi:hypothetical protein